MHLAGPPPAHRHTPQAHPTTIYAQAQFTSRHQLPAPPAMAPKHSPRRTTHAPCPLQTPPALFLEPIPSSIMKLFTCDQTPKSRCPPAVCHKCHAPHPPLTLATLYFASRHVSRLPLVLIAPIEPHEPGGRGGPPMSPNLAIAAPSIK